MPSSKFVVRHKINKSFRTDKIKGMFDIDFNEIVNEWDVNIPIENSDWNIGVIVGSSGSGKTTIAKKVFSKYKIFSGFKWNSKSIVDNFNDSLDAKKIVEALSKVGFSSPPDWLKPFDKLSNGQKMRVELARLILENDEPIIYDEFTSVIDRQIAKIGSSAIQKYIRKENKQFIAVSCHYDILEWLEPDWIYDVSKNKFSKRLLRRPKIRVKIRNAEKEEWEMFKNFHYLSHTHNNSAHKYIAEINNEIVAWCSVLHFPHPHVKNMKKIHRIVVMPDYQGIGLGSRFLNEICKIYKRNKNRVTLVTSSPSFVHGLQHSKNWIMTRKPSRVSKQGKNGATAMTKTMATERLTASFEYVGN